MEAALTSLRLGGEKARGARRASRGAALGSSETARCVSGETPRPVASRPRLIVPGATSRKVRQGDYGVGVYSLMKVRT